MIKVGVAPEEAAKILGFELKTRNVILPAVWEAPTQNSDHRLANSAEVLKALQLYVAEDDDHKAIMQCMFDPFFQGHQGAIPSRHV